VDIEISIINYKPWIRLIDLYLVLGMNKSVFSRYADYTLVDNAAMVEGTDFLSSVFKGTKHSKSVSLSYGVSTTVAKHLCYNKRNPSSRKAINWILELEKEYFIFS
jgi:phage anti-repressor protein